jgi:hypothetical protein
MQEILTMDYESVMVFSIILAVAAVTIGGCGRLTHIRDTGIEIATLFGHRTIAWTDVRHAVIHASPIIPFVAIVLRLNNVRFFSIYRTMAVILRNSPETDAKLETLSTSIVVSPK